MVALAPHQAIALQLAQLQREHALRDGGNRALQLAKAKRAMTQPVQDQRLHLPPISSIATSTEQRSPRSGSFTIGDSIGTKMYVLHIIVHSCFYTCKTPN